MFLFPISKAQISITNCTELQNIQNNLDANFVLDSHIDCSAMPFVPIGDLSTPFTGSFDGNIYSISNVNIMR